MIQSKVLNPEPGIFATILTDGEINNNTILYISAIKNFFSNQFKSSKWGPLFVLNLKNWYLSKRISFLKCPLIPTFLLLIKARRCNQKKRKHFLSRTHSLGSFLPVRILSLISVKTTEGHM